MMYCWLVCLGTLITRCAALCQADTDQFLIETCRLSTRKSIWIFFTFCCLQVAPCFLSRFAFVMPVQVS